MATFVLLGTEDAESAGGALAGGSRALSAFVKAVQDLGGRNVRAWATAGRFDVVCVADFPDGTNVLAVSMLAGAMGRHIEALPAGTEDDVETARQLVASVLSTSEAKYQEERTSTHMPPREEA